MTKLQRMMKLVRKSDLPTRKRCKKAFEKMLSDQKYADEAMFRYSTIVGPIRCLFIWSQTDEGISFWNAVDDQQEAE